MRRPFYVYRKKKLQFSGDPLIEINLPELCGFLQDVEGTRN